MPVVAIDAMMEKPTDEQLSTAKKYNPFAKELNMALQHILLHVLVCTNVTSPTVWLKSCGSVGVRTCD